MEARISGERIAPSRAERESRYKTNAAKPSNSHIGSRYKTHAAKLSDNHLGSRYKTNAAKLSNGHFGSRYKTRRGARAWRCRFVSGCCSARCETHPPNGKLKKLVPLVRGKHYFADVLPVRVLPSAKLMLPSWKPVRK